MPKFWNGQKYIELLDPNILASKDHLNLLDQLIESNSWVNFNARLDIRLTNEENICQIMQMKIKMIHFAWDFMKNSEVIISKLKTFKEITGINERRTRVYVLTNFDTTHEEDLYRIYKLKELEYDPYVMIYDKLNASKKTKRVARWVNNKFIYRACEKFEQYLP